jgi:hypothetical protein
VISEPVCQYVTSPTILDQKLTLTLAMADKFALFYWLVHEQSAGDGNAPSQGDAAALAAKHWRLHDVKRYSVAFTVVIQTAFTAVHQ